ncbi:MAG: NlpC/P60 family protein [Desulfobacteraceae bacterium]|nr:NlpC/P60 family protein [Desulfobacteraceae bacterium]
MTRGAVKIDHRKYLAIPYRQADCWELIRRVFADCGQRLPSFAVAAADAAAIAAQVDAARPAWRRLAAPEAPCVVAICNDDQDPARVNHFGVYLGDGTVLHTLEASGPCVWRLSHRWWAPRIEGYYVPAE